MSKVPVIIFYLFVMAGILGCMVVQGEETKSGYTAFKVAECGDLSARQYNECKERFTSRN